MPNCKLWVSQSFLCREQPITKITLLQDPQKNICSLALMSVNDTNLLMAGSIYLL